MHSYFRNHQLYLAERSEWLDRHVNKTSKRALMKIESWKLISEASNEVRDKYNDQLCLVRKLIKESLLTPIENKRLLTKEGFYLSNLSN